MRFVDLLDEPIDQTLVGLRVGPTRPPCSCSWLHAPTYVPSAVMRVHLFQTASGPTTALRCVLKFFCTCCENRWRNFGILHNRHNSLIHFLHIASIPPGNTNET